MKPKHIFVKRQTSIWICSQIHRFDKIFNTNANIKRTFISLKPTIDLQSLQNLDVDSLSSNLTALLMHHLETVILSASNGGGGPGRLPRPQPWPAPGPH